MSSGYVAPAKHERTRGRSMVPTDITRQQECHQIYAALSRHRSTTVVRPQRMDSLGAANAPLRHLRRQRSADASQENNWRADNDIQTAEAFRRLPVRHHSHRQSPEYNQPLFNNKQLQWPASIASTVSTNIMQVSRPQNPLSIDRVATLRAVLRGHDVVHGVLHRSSPILSSPNFPSEVPQDMLRKRSLFRGVKGLILCVVAYFGRTLYMFDVVGSAAPGPGPGPRLADGSLATPEAALLTQVPRNRFSFSSDGSAEPAYRDDYPRALLDARPAVAMRLATAAVAEHSVGILRVCGLDLLLGSGSFQDVYLLAAGRDEMAAWVCVLKSLI